MTSEMDSVCISQNGIYVTFYSDSKDEIDAIRNCFGYFWNIVEPSNKDEGWTVVSNMVSSIKDIIDISKLTLSTGLFKKAPLKKLVINKKHYYAHYIENVACLTCFDLENKTTYFYHEQEINEYSYIRNLVREPITANYIESGNILMHASAFSINDKGILVPGQKGAGKSTLLSHLLESGASYIGNDAVLCKKENDSVILTAFPQCLRLSKETIKNNRSLSDYYEKESYDFINKKVEFLPISLDSIFTGHQSTFISKLNLIIIPTIDLSRTDYSLDVVEDKEINGDNSYMSLLQKSIFHQYHSYIWSPFFRKFDDPLIDVNNLANVFKSVPKICFLKYGNLDAEKQKELYHDISNII